MCRPVPCKTCGRTTWAGCGLHVADVLAAVPPAERCPGHARPDQNAGWLRRLFSR